MDLRFKFDTEELSFDLDILRNELEHNDGLETAVLISLFSDARCEIDELPVGEISRRGYWGDALLNDEKLSLGSKLWLLERAKQTEETLELAREYALDSLQWLVSDGIAESINVETSYLRQGVIQIQVEIAKPRGSAVNSKFGFVWEARGNVIPAAYA